MRIVEFLLARIEEDESAAQAASVPYDQWDAVGSSDGQVAMVSGITGHVAPRPGLPTAQHIARHDPARVLAECAAKRGVIGLLTVAEQHVADVRRSAPEYRFVSAAESPRDAILCAVQLLAAVYADHPEFDPAWRMTTG